MAKLIFKDRISKNKPLLVGCSAQILDSTGKNVLLTKRTDNGRWCLPGGKIDSGESVAETCAREVLEETGLVVRVGQLIGVYSDPNMLFSYDDQHQYQIIAFHFAVAVIGGSLGLSNETTDVDYFSLDDIRKMDLMEHHRQRIADYFVHQKETFVR